MLNNATFFAVVPPGGATPTSIQVNGIWECNGSPAGGETVEFQFTSPGGPVVSATSSIVSPLGRVALVVPASLGMACGDAFKARVRGTCNGQWQPWVDVYHNKIDCGPCPRIVLGAPVYGTCTGTAPRRKPVTLSATVYLPPGASSGFTWDFGDGQLQAVAPITNTTSNPSTPFAVSVTHDYDETASALQACLRPDNGECPSACVSIDARCPGATPCPVPSVTTSYGPCGPGNAVPVTFTITFSPPIPQGTPTSCVLTYGGTDQQGQNDATIGINNTTAPVSSVSHTATFIRTANDYDASAVLTTFITGQPVCARTVPVPFNPPPCIVCPDPQNPVTVTIQMPSGATWCAPVSGSLAAVLSAAVNWRSPAPNPPPAPVRYDWTVTLPSGAGTATQSTTTSSVNTASGWNGGGATAPGGALNLSQAGTYSVSVTVIFPPNSGLPTDANGVVSCNTNAPASFRLDPCTPCDTCPTLTDISAQVGCISDSTPATVTVVTAAVDDPCGTAGGIDWDFGDPGSQDNQISTATANASHNYSSTGTFTVTARLRSNDPACPRPASVFSKTITVANCPPPPKSESDLCAILLWISMITMAVGLVAAIIGCLLSFFGLPQVGSIVGIIGLIVFGVGLVCFIIWLILCWNTTACSVLLAVIDFVRWMILVFGIIMLVVALLLIPNVASWPCLIGSAISWGWWGAVLAILMSVAEAAGCLVRRPNGSAGATSSALTGDGGKQRRFGALRIFVPFLSVPVLGLGSAISKTATLIGVQPCEPCKRRSSMLDNMVELHRVGR